MRNAQEEGREPREGAIGSGGTHQEPPAPPTSLLVHAGLLKLVSGTGSDTKPRLG